MPTLTEQARAFALRNERTWSRLFLVAGVGAVLLATAALIATGVVGLGRTSPRDVDFNYYYTAGKMLLADDNPYDSSVFVPRLTAFTQEKIHEDGVWAYPPGMTSVAALVALMPHTVGHWVLTVLNLIAVGVLALLSARLLQRPTEPRAYLGMAVAPWLIAALIIGNPFTARAIWLVQIVPVVAACMLGCWLLVQQNASPASGQSKARRNTLAGILLGVALLKPTIALLPALWFLLDRQWRVLFTAGAVVALMSAPAILVIGSAFLPTWFAAMEAYQNCPFDFLGADHLLGLPSFLVAVGGPATGATYALLVAALLTVVLWTKRKRFPRDDYYPILMSLQFGVVYGHPPDLISWLPSVGALWLHISRNLLAWPFLALGLALLCLPWRVLELLGLSTVARFGQTPIVLLTLIAFLVLGYRFRTRTEPIACAPARTART